MAMVTPTSFSLTLLSGNRVRINLDYRVDATATEARLEIPTRVYVKLMERDDTRDQTNLHTQFWQEWIRERGDEDEEATGWMFAGTHVGSTTASFSRELDRGSLPGESGNEEWYCVTMGRPDIWSDVWYSSEIVANLA
jgi:hypothetical protein